MVAERKRHSRSFGLGALQLHLAPTRILLPRRPRLRPPALAAVAFCALVFWTNAPRSQAAGAESPPLPAPTATAHVQVQNWTVELPGGEAAFRQTLVATSFTLPALHPTLSLRGYVPVAWSTDEEADADLSGLGDARLRLTYRRPAASWSLTGGIDLPTGKTSLTTNEYQVAARMLASRVLDFGFKRPGEGFDIMLGAAAARPVGRNTVLGLAAAGYLKGAYTVHEPEGGERLRAEPGDRLHLSLSLLVREHDQNPDWDLRTALGLQIAQASWLDQGATREQVREGVAGTLEAVYGRRLGIEDRLTLSLFLLARDRYRLEEGAYPVADILGISTRWVGEVGASYRHPVHGLADLCVRVVHAGFRVDPGAGVNSRVTSLALSAERLIGGKTTLGLRATYGFGRTPWTSAEDPARWVKRNLAGTTLGITLTRGF
ncbi:MAG: hypothetical protein KAY32_15290 [Candidatus Eisenbacteria sp.]|nr:hypothetical protein [Candidatus Eisenbacteria bacterium]